MEDNVLVKDTPIEFMEISYVKNPFFGNLDIIPIIGFSNSNKFFLFKNK